MVLSDDIARFVRATGPEHTDVQARMAAFADEHDFPNIGPESGAVLRLLARLTDAETVFEFGSGFGYSASWFLRGGADRVVLTEFDADELGQGRAFMTDAGLADRCVFEEGDAMKTVERYDGPFDVALVDHQKERYADALRAVRDKISTGGVVVADNVMRGPIDFDALLAHAEATGGRGDAGGDPDALAGANDETHGIAAYLNAVRDDSAFETVVLPVGSGLAVSTKTP
ncbi:O-methyltransferase [Halobaculum gomorrense]|uniref:Predicted O-methyltransferase YrrM n=1 Tax=Halobaculum gomorrense TaxID=43928 RepID=A0A1M5R7Z3_9EURY|nr:O-methyltransferase [Halobaculum gomorrense]SHH22156.1 Predicted O-methyltransferase YrrM [Halobaculum gomorrense]